MKHRIILLIFSIMLALPSALPAQDAQAYPTAIMDFTERGVGMKDMGQTCADIVFATLAQNNPELILVERKELSKILAELRLNASAIVPADKAAKIGQLTGARIIVTGTVFKAGKKNYVIAKIIGTETSRVLGAAVNGTDDVPVLAEKLAEMVAKKIKESAGKLMPAPVSKETRLAQLKKSLGQRKLPPCSIKVSEKHIGQPTTDPAAQTELTHFYTEAGGTVIDNEKAANVAYRIVGEGFSEFASEIEGLKSVKARLEIKVIDQNGRVVAAERQTSVRVDVTEAVAGKEALQEAAAEIALRLLPKLAK